MLFGNVFHSVLLYFIFSFCFCISSVITQKDESQNRSNKKSKHAKFSEKTNVSCLLIRTCAYLGGKNVLFFLFKFGILSFLVTSILGFAFLSYNRRTTEAEMKSNQIMCCSSVIRYKKFGSIPREFSNRTFFCSLFKIGFLSLFDDLFLFMPLLFLIAGTYSFL